jgi:hypothetical protein
MVPLLVTATNFFNGLSCVVIVRMQSAHGPSGAFKGHVAHRILNVGWRLGMFDYEIH